MKRKAPAAFLMLFSLPFVGVGLFVLSLAFRSVHEANQMKQWTPVEARLLESNLERKRSDKSYTYRVTARYRYTVDGRDYEGERVGLHGGSDNIGSWHQDRSAELKRSGGRVTAYVNPANPGEAVLFPGARSEMVLFYGGFGGLFSLAGLGILAGGIVSMRRGAKQRVLEDNHPQEPWRWREDWAAGVIRSSNRVTAITLLIAAVAWNGMLGLIVGLALQGRELPPTMALVLFGVFGLAGFGLLAWGIRKWRVYRRYGAAEVHLASVPGVLGGKLAGVVALPGYAEPEEYRLLLSCDRTVRRGKNSTTENVWKAERVLDAGTLPAKQDGVQIPILFGIPMQLPESGGAVNWSLKVSGRQPGIDVDVRFIVPVFQTAESRPDFVLDEAAYAKYLRT